MVPLALRALNRLCFFFNDTATTEIYTLSLHDALPICSAFASARDRGVGWARRATASRWRSEEHTSELQSHSDLVCRLLLEKKTNTYPPRWPPKPTQPTRHSRPTVRDT